jgi:tripartite ATP-independent transporter DctM subunit
MLLDWLAPLLFIAVFGLIFLGYPVALSLGGVALIFAVLAVELGGFSWAYMGLFADRLFGILQNQVLLSVPYFVLMGALLERSRLAEDLLRTIGLLLGPLRGGLALAVVFVGTLLAAATGVVGASVVAMGMISLPVMLRYGYQPALSCGTIAAAGTLGQIIPPSVVLVVLGDQMGVSVGDLFKGSLLPGLALAGLYAVYVAFIAWRRPELAPALPVAERAALSGRILSSVGRVLLPPLLLIVVVLGSIFAGVATPTEAGALGSMGALLLAAANRRLTRQVLSSALQETMRLTAMVVLLLVGSTLFSLVFRGLNGDLWIEEHLTNLPGGRLGFLVLTNLAVFVLGCFIDFFEIAFILLPLFVPAARALGFDDAEMVWYGVVLAMNLQTSFLTPPFGFALFYLRGVAPKTIATSTIYRGVLPFIAIQLLMLVVVIVFPGLVSVWF